MSAFDPADMVTAEMGATKLSCRMRCFGLPLYSAIAHEASALWLGFCLSVLRTCTYIWCSFRAEPVMPPDEQQSVLERVSNFWITRLRRRPGNKKRITVSVTLTRINAAVRFCLREMPFCTAFVCFSKSGHGRVHGICRLSGVKWT